MYSFKDKNAYVKFAKFECPECNNIVLGLRDEFVGNFEMKSNPPDEMFYVNSCEHCIDSNAIAYEGTCPSCGRFIKVPSIKYLILDFSKF